MSAAPEKAKQQGFFVGYYKKVPREIALFCIGVGAFLVGAFAALSFGLAYNTDDPVAASYTTGVRVSGVYLAEPYPMLWTSPDPDDPSGHALLLAGEGKSGAQAAGRGHEGQAVIVTGALLKRGTIDMLVVDSLAAETSAPAEVAVPALVPLGRWRAGGEICDGKCKAGAMKPGAGLAHKACANLCIQGGLPPIFVTVEPIAGSNFLVLASESGGPLADGSWTDLVARPAVLEGAVERRGDLLVLKADWARVTGP